MGNDICVYVITHKKIEKIRTEGYRILLVGACKNNRFENDYIHDDTGDNISEYNDSYCELTGLYWMWKNSREDIIGLVHYRRLFAKLGPHIDFIGRHLVLDKKDAYSLLTPEDIRKKLQNADIIVKESEFRITPVKKIFCDYLGTDFFDRIEEAVRELSPEYMGDFARMCSSHTHINCNMFIGKREIAERYCGWLFPILSLIDEKKIKESGERYHNREMGYVSELLFGVWLRHNNIRYTVGDVVYTDDPMVQNGVLGIGDFWGFLVNRTVKKLHGKEKH